MNTESALWKPIDDFFRLLQASSSKCNFVGMHEFDHLLPDFSAVSVGDTVYEMKELLNG